MCRHDEIHRNYEELKQLMADIWDGCDGLIKDIRIFPLQNRAEVIVTVRHRQPEPAEPIWVNIRFLLTGIFSYKLFKRENYDLSVLSPYGIQVSCHEGKLYIDFDPYDEPVKIENIFQSRLYFCCSSVKWDYQ